MHLIIIVSVHFYILSMFSINTAIFYFYKILISIFPLTYLSSLQLQTILPCTSHFDCFLNIFTNGYLFFPYLPNNFLLYIYCRILINISIISFFTTYIYPTGNYYNTHIVLPEWFFLSFLIRPLPSILLYCFLSFYIKLPVLAAAPDNFQ